MIIHQLIMLFGFILVGYVANKTKILDDISNQKISKFLINITIPATIINSSIGQASENNSNVLIVFLVAVCFYILIPIMSRFISKLLKQEPTFELMLTYSNLGFMGIPIVEAIYGKDIVFYVTIFMMIFNISIFSMGILTLSKNKTEKNFSMKQFLNPGIISAIIAIIIYGFKIQIQNDISNIIANVGSITTPLAMIIIGSTLGEIQLQTAFSDMKMYIFVGLKLIGYPILIYVILRMLRMDEQIIGVVVILTSLPTAGNVSMVCSEYGGDMNMVTKGICISTLFSVITIPLWINFIS